MKLKINVHPYISDLRKLKDNEKVINHYPCDEYLHNALYFLSMNDVYDAYSEIAYCIFKSGGNVTDFEKEIQNNFRNQRNKEEKTMDFASAFISLQRGHKIKRKHWTGYWVLEDGEIIMHTYDGRVINIRESEDIMYTVSNMACNDWEIADKYGAAKELKSECKENDGQDTSYSFKEIKPMSFGKAINKAKQGKKIFRLGWNDKGMFVVYQKGYPDGIPCNKQTAEAWGMNEGDVFKCEPYLQIKTTSGSHAMWTPSTQDVLAEDWYYIH